MALPVSNSCFHGTFSRPARDTDSSRILVGRNELRGLQLACRPSPAASRGCSSVRMRPSKFGLARAYKNGDQPAKLVLRVEHQVAFGESVAVLGSAKWLGRWREPVEMRWGEEGWSVEVDAKRGEEAEFKFVVCQSGDGRNVRQWEDGPNRRLSVPADASLIRVAAKWDAANPLTIEEVRTLSAGPGAENGSAGAALGQNGRFPRGAATDQAELDASAFAQSWQGREVGFMRSNEHSRERRGVWDTAGLSGPALAIVEGDKSAGNWWRKLEVVQRLLESPDARASLDHVIYSAIYLQWVNTGQISCVEDGGHHRPNKHASISRAIFQWLEKEPLQQLVDTSPKAVLVRRRLHQRLPAFTAEFTASVPLTRIRDIAHRNDIPHDLKQEIKHTIQNKLHRNAGPEDLVATELLLRRVSAREGEYSAAFVEQLRIFYRELKDFFNASSLTEQLEALRPSLDERATPMLANFLATKEKFDELGAGEASSAGGASSRGTVDVVLAALHSLTGLRAALAYHLSSGLRNDAPDESIAMRQKWRLSEIGLEDYSFVLLSRLVNEVEKLGGSTAVASEALGGSARLFDVCVGAAVLALRQVGLSGWAQRECLCLEHELAAWQTAGMGTPQAGGVVSPRDLRWWALRFKGSLDRAKRLTEEYTETQLELYSSPSQILGKAMGIEEVAVRTYAEAEIRASVVFQLNKLVTLLLRALRSVLGSEGWDVLMPGTATGTLRKVERIDPASLEACREDTILLLQRADGDEEVRAAGSAVRALILLQELPHLSHLAVRARQERVPFVTCEDSEKIRELEEVAQRGQRILLEASADGVKLTIPAPATAEPQGLPGPAEASVAGASTKSGAEAEHSIATHLRVHSAATDAFVPLVPLADASLATSGAKAVSCAQLLRLSALSLSDPSSEGSFYAPQGAVIPFGTLEEALRRSGAQQEFLALVDASQTAPLHDLEGTCSRLRALVEGVTVPSETMQLLGSTFDPSTRLIVRSSANVEDLAGMSGAGLYESIPNVTLADPRGFSRAVAEVWASLFSRRAVLSRRAAGVQQRDATMAVLVQELADPELSFVLHTKSPLDGSPDAVHAEIAPGLGETLASGTRGTPWRLAADKSTGAVEVLALANFSEQLLVRGQGQGQGRDEVQGPEVGTVQRAVVDYSRQRLSTSREALEALAVRLAHVGRALEESMGGAQDIEGCLVGPKLVVVQSRPQP